ncbi:hypothetical protein H6P81_014940 [Aristolochia fimbriata]|uniref:Uncharacterized protein n=1 Tax=Aristolochia fimbriata TaxID=158543 RepID=A0AAV7E3U4_ARIFI|nr:hypothetical protein H6P81_014940 [Aristolochia fimbriata]
MLRLLVNVRRALMKSSKRRVADESALGRGDHGGVEARDGALDGRRGGGGGAAAEGGLLIMRGLVALLGCVSPHQFNADEGLWLSGEISRASERDYLMVRDSMRYAIYV